MREQTREKYEDRKQEIEILKKEEKRSIDTKSMNGVYVVFYNQKVNCRII